MEILFRDAAELGYTNPCPICGRVEDTPGPCSVDCEETLERLAWEKGEPHCINDPDDTED